MRVGPGTYPRVEHQNDVSYRWDVDLLENIRLGCEGIPRINYLACLSETPGALPRVKH